MSRSANVFALAFTLVFATALQAEDKEDNTASSASPAAQQIITFMDKDGNGKISKDEAAASAELKPYFGQFDTNRDGAIDVKEAEVIVQYAP